MSIGPRSSFVPFAIAIALAATHAALADKVATTHAGGTAPLAERAQMRTATELAAKGLGHVTVAENDVLQGEAAAGDAIGTSAGLVAIGKTTGADWVVVPTIASNEHGTRLELKVCQVATGRVETLARDLDPKVEPTQQVREMLQLMLRPQGIGDDSLPAPVSSEQKKPAPSASVSAAYTASAPTPMPAAPPVRYGEGRVALGAGGGVADVIARPKEARGKRFGWTWNATLLVPLPRRPWLEILGRFSGVHGPGNALAGDVGARATWIAPSRFALGAEAFVGVFGQLGGAKTTQFSVGASPVVAIALSRALTLDVRPATIRLATGADAGSVGIFSADVALFVRF